MLAFMDGGRVELQNRKGHCRTIQYPELLGLNRLIKAKEAVLDGEVVVMDQGKPSFPRVIQRDFLHHEQAIKRLARDQPSIYCLFDLIYLDGEDLTTLPLHIRLTRLAEITDSKAPLYLNENFQNGVNLYNRVINLGLEGIVAKKKESSYRLGVKTDDWVKIKPRTRRLCAVGGFSIKNNIVGSLLLGAWQKKDFLYIGRAGSGLSRKDLITLKQYAGEHAEKRPPFVNPPAGKGFVWVKPELTVNIDYMEWTSHLRLRAPVVAGFSARPPDEAIL